MNRSPAGRVLRSSLIGALCALFFLLAMGVTLLSGSVYRSVAQQSQAHYTHRTALSYLLNQVRRCADAQAPVLVGTFGGQDALILPDGEYLTLLYCYDGALRELYTQPGSGLTAADGVSILPLDSLEISLSQEGLISLSAQAQGADHHASILPRCGADETGEVSL